MTPATVLLPDLDDEITNALVAVEEILIALDAWEDDEPGLLPYPLTGGLALEAVRRLWTAIAPTQGPRAVEAGLTGRQYAPDERTQHLPLRLVTLDQGDVELLAAAARALGDPLGPEQVREILAELAPVLVNKPDAPTALVMRTAQLAGLLTLEETGAVRLLKNLLAGLGPADDVVFTELHNTAYAGTADRINQMWTLSDPLRRWQY